MTKQKKIEQDYFDFIEDSREVEGRLFQRWQTCVLLSLTSGSLSSVDRTVSDSSDPQFRETPATSSAAGDGNEFRSARPARKCSVVLPPSRLVGLLPFLSLPLSLSLGVYSAEGHAGEYSRVYSVFRLRYHRREVHDSPRVHRGEQSPRRSTLLPTYCAVRLPVR